MLTNIQTNNRLLSNTRKVTWKKQEVNLGWRGPTQGIRNGRTKGPPGRVRRSSLCHDSGSQFLPLVQEQAASPNAEIHILKKKGRKRKVRAAGGFGYT